MGGPMDMIFGVLLETFLRLLKSFVLQFFSKYSKSYNDLNVKTLLNTRKSLNGYLKVELEMAEHTI